MNRLKAALPTFGSTSTNSTDSNAQEDCPISRDRVNLIESNQLVVKQIHSSLLPFYKGVAKTRSNPLRQGLDIKLKAEERFSCEWLGDTLNKCSEDIQAINGHDTQYSSTLALVGDAHLELGNLTKSYADSLQQGLIATLEEKLEDFKQFEKLLARADKKRNQLQGIMNKTLREHIRTQLEKGNSKKDTRSELEHELDQAEWTYRDACDQLTRKADELEQQATPSIVEALQGVIDAQLDFATNYTNMLTSIRTRLPPVSISVSHSTSPTRSRSSSTLQSPPSLSAATRMNRSLSESSALQNVPTQFLSNSILSSLGPGRTRSQTVVEEMKDKEKESKDNKEVKNRSRSGSMLERFALVGKKKRDKTLAAEDKEEKDENGVVEGERNGEKEDNNNRSRSNSASGSARGGGGGWATPSLPSLGSGSSFSKKPSNSSSYGYGSLRDSDEQHPTSTTPFDFSSSSSSNITTTVVNPTSPSSSSPSSKTRRFVPPLLKRTQTAPASTSSTTSSPSSPSGRFTQPSSPLKSTFSSSISSSTKTPKNLEDQIRVRARWAYSPNVRDQDELEFEKGDFVRVSKEVNTDWWIGTNETSGESGMFPSAYVVVVVVPQEPEREEEEDRYGRSDSDPAEEEEEGRRRRLSIDDRDSLRSSTTTTSTRSFRDSDDDEEEENEFLQPTRSSKPFSSSTTSSTPYNPSSTSSTPRPAAPLPPRPPTMTRNGSTTPRKPPPPPPPARRTNSGGNLLLNGSSKKEKEVEGSPFD